MHHSFKLVPASTGFFLGLLFDPENGGGMFLQNVQFSPNCMELEPEDWTLPKLSYICDMAVNIFML
jgi:hypothetical protein